jgi:hypothetical protein
MQNPRNRQVRLESAVCRIGYCCAHPVLICHPERIKENARRTSTAKLRNKSNSSSAGPSAARSQY